MIATALYAVSLFCLIGCGDSQERVPADAPGYVNGKAVHPTIKIGRPYRVMGRRYYPEYDPDYNEVGIASWYGPNFHGKSTANGEKYNQWAMTAAHKTLPLPSMVRVTNLENGRSAVVRVNDRGPFADGRIIDLSKAAAEELGTRAKGLAKVRVEYLKPETEQYIAKLQLKKPQAWRDVDIAMAKEEEQVVALAEADVTTQAIELKTAHELLPAQEVPQHFAFNYPEPQQTTLDVRGVVLEEIGYAQDPFSVLDTQEESSVQPNHSPAVTAVSFEPDPSLQQQTPARSAAAKKTAQLFVQAASFGVRENAVTLANRLQSLANVEVMPMQTSRGPLWRVRLGPTFNRGVANEIIERLSAYDIHDAKIVTE